MSEISKPSISNEETIKTPKDVNVEKSIFSSQIMVLILIIAAVLILFFLATKLTLYLDMREINNTYRSTNDLDKIMENISNDNYKVDSNGNLYLYK